MVDIYGNITGIEVLARWPPGDGTFIAPSEFIPVAIATGHIISLTRSLLAQAARELSRALDGHQKPFHVAFNMPAVYLADGHFLDDYQTVQATFAPGTVQLAIEITGHDTVYSLEHVIPLLAILRTGGVQIALDDFGTGNSNLDSLCRPPLTTVKLDRYFCTGLPGSVQSLTAAIITQLSHSLGLKVLAEGVETLLHITNLSAMGVDAFQGFYFSPPVPLQKLLCCFLPAALALPRTMRHHHHNSL